MIYRDINELRSSFTGVLKIADDRVEILDHDKFKNILIDDLVYSAVFSPSADVREAAFWLIRRAGTALGILSASIHNLYHAMGKNEASGFTVPAINLRGLTYDAAQAVFRVALKGKVT